MVSIQGKFKVQVRDLVRVLGIVALFATLVVSTRAAGGNWALVTCAGCPQRRYATGEPGQVQGRDREGIVEGSCGYRTRGVSFKGSSFYRESWGMVAPHCHWRSNIGPWLLATVIRSQIVNPYAPHCHKRTDSSSGMPSDIFCKF